MVTRSLLFAVAVVLAPAVASAESPTIATAPGSSGACASAGVNLCVPGGDVIATFPPAAPGAAYTAPLGLLPGDVVNSFSWLYDDVSGGASIRFSVDGLSIGAAGAVVLEAAAGEAAADIFTAGTVAAPTASVLTADGDGLPAGIPPAIGLAEMSGGGAPPFDDLSALATCSGGINGAFTLAPGSPTLALLGAGPADVLVGLSGFNGIALSSAYLGLVAGDVVDALAWNIGTGTVRFSLAPGSPSLALIGAGPADILAPGPVVAIAAAAIGLAPTDNIDALDISLDPDGDLVASGCDNCPAVANNDQLNGDGDALGDACDSCTDSDGDGFGDPGYAANTCPDDNCPTASNPTQVDADGDGAGDACDLCPNGDDQLDGDGDGVPDACDTCPGFDDRDPANPCPTLFGLEYEGSPLRIYNPYTHRTLHTVAVTLAGETITAGRGLAVDPVSGVMYGLLEIMGQTGMELVSIDPTTGIATDIGDTGDSFRGMTTDCAGTLYTVTDDVYVPISFPPETLVRLDKATAAPTLVLPLGNGDTGEGIAFRPLDGSIYHTSGNSTQIFESIQLPTLAITNIPLLGSSGSVHALVYWEAGDVFLAAYGFSSAASRITPGGVATLDGSWGSLAPPYAFPFALAFTGASPNCAAPCPPAPAAGCTAAPKSLLLVKDSGADGAGPGDKLLWKWLKGPATAQGDFGEPTVGTAYALCVYAGAVPALTLQAAVDAGGTCGGSECWRPIGDTGYRYANATPGPPGISLIKLKGGAAGRSKILLKGRDGGLPITAASLPLDAGSDVVVQLHNGDTAACWSATFPPASVRTSSGVRFKARAP